MNSVNFCNYETCCPDVREQIENTAKGLVSLLQSKIAGVYLGGSMVLGAFDKNTSDIDLTVVVNNDLSLSDKVSITSFLLTVNRRPCRLEIVFIVKETMLSSQRPPIHLFFCDYWIKTHKKVALGEGNVEELLNIIFSDSDVITELKLIKQSGICVYGLPINEMITDVQDELFWDTLSSQAVDSYVESEDVSQSAFKILQLCRFLAYAKIGIMLSKPKAAEWAITEVPSTYHSVILFSLYEKYKMGDGTPCTVDEAKLFKLYVLDSMGLRR